VAPPAAPPRRQTSGHETQLLSASLDFQIRPANSAPPGGIHFILHGSIGRLSS
jgi:hypothetical protein